MCCLQESVQLHRVPFWIPLRVVRAHVSRGMPKKHLTRLPIWELGTNLPTTSCCKHTKDRGPNGGNHWCTSQEERDHVT